MKRILSIVLLLAFALTPYAQQQRTTRKAGAKKTVVAGKSKSRQPQKKKKRPAGQSTAKQPTVTSLQNQRKQIQKRIKEQEQRLRNNEAAVKKRLQNLMVINSEIEGKRRTIDTIKHDISNLDVEIEELGMQLDQLHPDVPSSALCTRVCCLSAYAG